MIKTDKAHLMFGDCLERMDELIAAGVVVDAIITDPPYGTTACKWDTVIPFDQMWPRLHKLIKPNGAIVLFGSEPFSSALRMSNIKNYKYDWVWNKVFKTGHLNAKKKPMLQHEIVSVFANNTLGNFTYNAQKTKGKLRDKSPKRNTDMVKGRAYGVVKKQKSNINDEMYPSSIIEISTAHQKGKLHPTQKPVALMEYLIKTYTNEHETVLDFTMGSGSTGVAAMQTNRKFIGIELDPGYFSIACERVLSC